MMDTPPEVTFSFAEAAKAILIGIGSITLWLLKKLGDKHIASLDIVLAKQDQVLEKLNAADVRLAVLESKVYEHIQKHSSEH